MSVIRILLILLSISLTFLSYEVRRTIDEDKAYFLNVIPIFVLNDSNRDVPLYSSDRLSGKAVAQLKSGEVYQFKYSGKSGKWLHGVLNNQYVFIKNPSRKKVVLIFDTPVKLVLLLRSYWGTLVCMVLFVSSFIPRSSCILFSRTKIQDLEKLLIEKNEFINKQEKENIFYRTEMNKYKNDSVNALEEINQAKNELNYNRKKIQALKIKTHRYEFLKEHIEAALKQKEAELCRAFEESAESQSAQNLSSVVETQKNAYLKLEQKYNNLKNEHHRLKTEGLIFGIDFNSDRYENLLKGRKYELFFVNELLNSSDFEILRWTPDKGFENGIYVKSNGDPDLLIQYQKKLIFAVECKYRGRFYKGNSPPKVDWGYCAQAERYDEYGKEEKVPVFVAIGISGNPDKPKYNYLVPLDRLVQKSEELRWKEEEGYEPQKVIKISGIEDCLITPKISLEKLLLTELS